jgi:L-aminopeptidase/D-esterase-like protein
MARSGSARTGFAWGFLAVAVVTATTAASSAAPAATGPRTGIRAFKPVADTYVSSANPRGNFGRMRVLRVDGTPEETAYLRFSLRRVSGEITSVTLLLHATTATRASFAVRRVARNAWLERRLTYLSAPQPSSRYTASKPVRRGVWSAIDVTPFVGDGSGDVSLALTTRAARRLSFGSRESSHGPRLVVRFLEKNKELFPRVMDEIATP